jgi:hypothetical protein
LSLPNFEAYIGDDIELTIEAHDSICTNLKVWQATSISLKVQYITSINLKCERLKIKWGSKGRRSSNVESLVCIFCQKPKKIVCYFIVCVLFGIFFFFMIKTMKLTCKLCKVWNASFAITINCYFSSIIVHKASQNLKKVCCDSTLPMEILQQKNIY